MGILISRMCTSHPVMGGAVVAALVFGVAALLFHHLWFPLTELRSLYTFASGTTKTKLLSGTTIKEEQEQRSNDDMEEHSGIGGNKASSALVEKLTLMVNTLMVRTNQNSDR